MNTTSITFSVPTLMFFVGSTGCRIGSLFEKLLKWLPEKQRKHIEYQFYDSLPPDSVDYSRCLQIFYKDFISFQQEGHRKFCETRLPQNLGKTIVINSTQGNGLCRICGECSLVNCKNQVMDNITGMVSRLIQNGCDMSQRIQIYIVCASFGGTGSGQVIDLSAILYDYFKRTFGESPSIYPVLVGPDSLIHDPKIDVSTIADKLKATDYALHKEIHHFESGNPFESYYSSTDHRIYIQNQPGDSMIACTYYFCSKGNNSNNRLPQENVEIIIAETLMQLSCFEPGKKIHALMPNQREAFTKKYPQDFNHSDHKWSMSSERKMNLQRVSRNANLSGVNIQHVRLCVNELFDYFVADTQKSCLSALLSGQSGKLSLAYVHKILGIYKHENSVSGMTQQWGLGHDNLLTKVQAVIEDEMITVRLAQSNINPDKLLRNTLQGLTELKDIVSRMTIRSSNVLPESIKKILSDVEQKLNNDLLQNGIINNDLTELTFCPIKGKGIVFTSKVIQQLIQYTTEKAANVKKIKIDSNIFDEIQALDDRLHAIRKECEKQQDRFIGKSRLLYRKLMGNKNPTPYHSKTLKKIENLRKNVVRIKSDITHLLETHILSQITGLFYQQQAALFKQYEKDYIKPLVQRFTTALSIARQKEKICINKLKVYEKNGIKFHHVKQLGSDSVTIGKLRKKPPDESTIIENFLEMLSENGIVVDDYHLRIESLPGSEPDKIFDAVHAYVLSILSPFNHFIYEGWHMEDIEHLFNEAAKQLDLGSFPLLNYDDTIIKNKVNRWLIAPENLYLPEPFGRNIATSERLVGNDPLMISVISFVFGIPPNSLLHIHDYFEQYMNHICDHLEPSDDQDPNRFPLHTFRDAWSWQEIHSPLEFDQNKEDIELLLDLGREFGIINGDKRVSLSNRIIITDVDEWMQATYFQDGLIVLNETLLKNMLMDRKAASIGKHYFMEKESLYSMHQLYNKRASIQ